MIKNRWTELGTVLLLFFSVLPKIAYGDNSLSFLDVGIKLGMMTGTIGSASANEGKKNKFGGLNIALAFIHDHNDTWSTFFEPQAVVDLVNHSTLRTGAGLGLLWHLMGGPRKIQKKVALADTEFRSRHNLSLLARSGYYAYSARDPLDLSEPVTGSIFENFLGFNFAMNATNSTRIGFEIGSSLINFSTSIERLQSSSMEIGFIVRITL